MKKLFFLLFSGVLFSLSPAYCQQPGDGLKEVFPLNNTNVTNRKANFGFSHLVSANYDYKTAYIPGDRVFYAQYDWQATDSVAACADTTLCTGNFPGEGSLFWECLTCITDGGGPGIDLSPYVRKDSMATQMGLNFEDTPLTGVFLREDAASPSGYFARVEIDTVAADARWGGGGGDSTYTLPTLSASVKGGAKLGKGLEMNGDTLNVKAVSTNFIYISPDGDDATGQRGNVGAPFATNAAAEAVYASGDVITVNPGVYSGQVALGSVAGNVTYQFAPGADFSASGYLVDISAGTTVTIRGNGTLTGDVKVMSGATLDMEFDQLTIANLLQIHTSAYGTFRGRRIDIAGNWVMGAGSMTADFYVDEIVSTYLFSTSWADYLRIRFYGGNLTFASPVTTFVFGSTATNFNSLEFHNCVINGTSVGTISGVGNDNSFNGTILLDNTVINSPVDAFIINKNGYGSVDVGSRFIFNNATLNAGSGYNSIKVIGAPDATHVPIFIRILEGGLLLNSDVNVTARSITNEVPGTYALRSDYSGSSPVTSRFSGILTIDEPGTGGGGGGSGGNADSLDNHPGSYYAPKASPSFTGNPTTGTTPALNDSTTSIPNTAFVDRAVSATVRNNSYNVKDFGAVGNGSTNDAAAFQATWNASHTATGNYYINIPAGVYKVSSQILIDDSTANVVIEGNGSTIIDFVSASGDAVIRIKRAKSVTIQNLKFDQTGGSTTLHSMIYLGDYANTKYVGEARILNCSFFNFADEDNRGITLENTPYDGVNGGGYSKGAAIIEGCNFYNDTPIAFASFNYSTATQYGIGIYLGEQAEYTRIINNSFVRHRIGIYSYGGANTNITGNNFLAMLPKLGGAYTYGAIFLDNTGLNNGKQNISGNKFNHNWGYSIYSKYATSTRPVTITANQFIASCATPIVLTHSSNVDAECRIVNNYFERASQAFTNSLSNQPFGAALLPFITLTNYSNNIISENTFKNDGTYGVVSTGTATANVIQNNKWASITGIASLTGTNTVFNNEATLTSSDGSLLVKGSGLTTIVADAPTGSNSFFSGKVNGTTYSYFGTAGATNGFLTGSALGDLAIRTDSKNILFGTAGASTTVMYIQTGNGNVGFGGVTSPTSKIHLSAGTTTVAPFGFTAGTNLTTPVSGKMEFDGTNFFGTNSTATRFTFAKTLSATATLNYGSIAAGATETLTITVTGAATGDVVNIGIDPASKTAGLIFGEPWVSATNTVSIECYNSTGSAIDPASGTFRASVVKY